MFDEAKFPDTLDQEIIEGLFYIHEEAFSVFSSVFRNAFDRHAPQKQKMVCENNVRIISKQLKKAIMDRSKIKDRYSKWTSRENLLELKKSKRLCKNLTK